MKASSRERKNVQEREGTCKRKKEMRREPVAKKHQMVGGSLALPYCFFLFFLFSYFNGSKALAPVGDEVL